MLMESLLAHSSSSLFDFRHSAAPDHPGNFISVLLGELPVASGPRSLQSLLHGPPSLLRHHQLGHHDFHHGALCSHLPHHVVRLQHEGWVFTLQNILFSPAMNCRQCNETHSPIFCPFPTEVSAAMSSFCMDHLSGLSHTLRSGLWPGERLHPRLHSCYTKGRLPYLHHVWDDRAWSCTHL